MEKLDPTDILSNNNNAYEPIYKPNMYGHVPISKKQSIIDGLISENIHKIQKYCYPACNQKLRKHN